MCEFSFNPHRLTEPNWSGDTFAFLKNSDMKDFHRSLRGYDPTPLTRLPGLSAELGTGEIVVKDESSRFGIKAFKALGASYAIFRVLKKKWESAFGSGFNYRSFKDEDQLKKLGKFTFCAASDGNHGKAVAWTARMLRQNAVIFMPSETVASRIRNIEDEDGQVVIVNGTYDDCVRTASEAAEKNGWVEISDTAYPNCTEIPSWVMSGYSTLFREALEQLPFNRLRHNDLVFLQAGAGAFAASGASLLTLTYGKKRPRIVIVEPLEAACYLESVRAGRAVPASGKMKTIMAGLNCGVPSMTAWPVLRDSADLFVSVSDEYAASAMRKLESSGIIAGESGAAGLAGLLALLNDKKLEEAKTKLEIGTHTRILLVNTEGDTDPENYARIIKQGQ